MSGELNERQKRFVRAYRETGNATVSAKRAGYAGNDDSLAVTGSKLLRNPKVAVELAKADEKAAKANIATVDELHEFWTRVLRGDEPAEMKDRLKASELRAKAAGVFVEKREVTGKDGGPQEVTVKADAVSAMTPDDLRRAARALLGGPE